MKKILLLSFGLGTLLSAAICPDNNRFYTIIYTSVSEKLKELESNNDGSGVDRTLISAYARTKCDIKCKIAAASTKF